MNMGFYFTSEQTKFHATRSQTIFIQFLEFPSAKCQASVPKHLHSITKKMDVDITFLVCS